MRKMLRNGLLSLLPLAFGGAASAAVPPQVIVQGALRDNTGKLQSLTATVIVKLFDGKDAGAKMLAGPYTFSAMVENGLFAVTIDDPAIGTKLGDGAVWLELTVGNDLYPRFPSGSQIFALKAGNADSADRLRGVPVSATAPVDGQFMKFSGGAWAPTAAPLDSGTGILNGTAVQANANFNISNAGTIGGKATVGNGLEVKWAGSAGGVSIGDSGCGEARYTGLSLTGPLSGCTNYNLLGDTVSKDLLINRGAGGSIWVRSGNVDQMSLSPAGDLRLGAETNSSLPLVDWGAALLFSGSRDDNSDPLWIARYNTGPNSADLRVVIGDDPVRENPAADRFVVGTMVGSGGFTKTSPAVWQGQFAVLSGGDVQARRTFLSNANPDLAETMPAAADVGAGDVVCADPKHRERAIRCTSTDRVPLGVISDGSGGFLINAHGGSIEAPLTGKPLVLAGRVPVKVSLENGAIAPGDLLAPSKTPGVAVKAIAPGPTVGIALEALAGAANKQGQVLTFIKVGEGNIAQAVARMEGSLTRLEADNDRLRKENAALRSDSESLAARLDRLEGTLAKVLSRDGNRKLASLRR